MKGKFLIRCGSEKDTEPDQWHYKQLYFESGIFKVKEKLEKKQIKKRGIKKKYKNSKNEKSYNFTCNPKCFLLIYQCCEFKDN